MPSRNLRLVLASVVACLFVAAGCSGSDDDEPPAASAAAQTTPAQTAEAETCSASKLTVNPIDPNVDGKTGASFNGDVCLANGDTVWALDYDPFDKTYYLTGNSPIVEEQGQNKWAWVDKPIGSPGETDMPYTIIFVVATPECAQTLAATPPNADGDLTMKQLPAKCPVSSGVEIKVTYPEE